MKRLINGNQYEVNRLTGLVMRYQDGYPISVSETEAAEVMAIAIARVKAGRNRRERDQAMRDIGMVKVRGNLGGTYWE